MNIHLFFISISRRCIPTKCRKNCNCFGKFRCNKRKIYINAFLTNRNRLNDKNKKHHLQIIFLLQISPRFHSNTDSSLDGSSTGSGSGSILTGRSFQY